MFEADATRSYRLLPSTRSVWVRKQPRSGSAEAWLLPDGPQIRSQGEALGYHVLEGTEQTTNSWGCRGPEPDLSADLRVLVIGDSYMQGMFVADSEAAPWQLESRLHALCGKTVSVLNTGHLGYSPEEYYYTAHEYVPRFRPAVVLVSVCFNDTRRAPGSERDPLAAHEWLVKVYEATTNQVTPPAICVLVLAPLHKNLEQGRNTGNYPNNLMDVAHFRGAKTLDPTEAFINEDLRLRGPREVGPQPLFNIPLGDAHFSARGCAVWADQAARRILLLLGIPESPPAAPHVMTRPLIPTEPRG